jgi:small subunit ribosomal protein S9
MSAQPNEIWATGRRKAASARVRMRPGTGRVRVNGKAIEEYFPSESVRGFIYQPLNVTDNASHVDIHANIAGGGPIGQAGALRHGITRALIKKDASYRPVLKDCGMLTRDARVKERKKSGQPGARKRFQFSKR